MKINLIQDEATPHNNLLIKNIDDNCSEILNLWYAVDSSKIYNWKVDLTNEVKKANVYGNKKINFELIKKIFTDEKIMIVGWTNITTRLMLVIMFILNRPYTMWFDLPNDNFKRSWFKNKIRNFFYFILRKSKSKVFCVGSETIKYFENKGFETERLINLPVFVPTINDNHVSKPNFNEVRIKLGIGKNDFLISSGSRLVKDKGFDLLIDSISRLEKKNNIKLVIIGQGEERLNLVKLVEKLNVKNNVLFLDWMDIDEMKNIISASNIFVHPARWDAFGAGTLNAMALGVPVIASNQSGSGPDRIKHKYNGFLYEASDTLTLTSIIEYCIGNQSELNKIAHAGRLTANEWSVDRGRKILLENII